jgi:ribosome-associated heat shock protein Hsp15
VRINRQKVNSASRPVRPGDVLTLALGRAVIVVTVVAIAARRGSASLAQTLYIRHEPETSSLPTQPRPRAGQDGTTAAGPSDRPQPQGRPGKRDRRQAAALKRHGGDN